MSASEREITVDGVRLHVRECGSGPPVLLINGIGAHVDMWRPLERALSGVRTIAFDAPGTGRSQVTLVPRTMGGLSRLVQLLLDELGLDRVDVLGYSFGGALAQQLAADAPHRVRRLVLAATLPGWGGVPGRLGALLGLSTPLRYYSKFVYTRTAGLVAGGRARRDPAYVEQRWEERIQHPPSPAGYGYQLWTTSMWSGFGRLHRIAAPSLIVIGDDDPVVPLSNAFLMASRMPSARVLVGAGEGHFLLLDEDSAVLSRITAFLTAPELAAEPVWRDALAPSVEDAAQRLGVDGLGALPWGAWSAIVRRAVDARRGAEAHDD